MHINFIKYDPKYNPINKKFMIPNFQRKYSTKKYWNFINFSMQFEIQRIEVFKKKK